MPGVLRLIMSTLGWQGLCRCSLGSRKQQEQRPHTQCSLSDQGVPVLPNVSCHHLSLVPSPKWQGPLSHGVVRRTPSPTYPLKNILLLKEKKKNKNMPRLSHSSTSKGFQPKPFYDFMIVLSGRKQEYSIDLPDLVGSFVIKTLHFQWSLKGLSASPESMTISLHSSKASKKTLPGVPRHIDGSHPEPTLKCFESPTCLINGNFGR